MRVAEICPICATLINANCVIYDGDTLSAIGVPALTSLDEILSNINDTFTILSGSGIPTVVPLFVGQQYRDTVTNFLYIGLSTTIPNWGLIGAIVTTTTTTSTSSTTTT